MKRFVLFFLLFPFGNCMVVVAQDSLYTEITKLPSNDTSTINTRNDYVKNALFTNPADSSLFEFSEKTLQMAEKLSYKKGMLLAFERMGLVQQYAFSNPYSALEFYLKALALADENTDLETYKWGVLGNIAIIYYEQEEYQKALSVFRKILQNNKEAELRSIANIANIYGSIGMPDSAIYYYQLALKSPQLTGNTMYQANLLSNLSLMYQQNGSLEESIHAIEQSLTLIDEHKIEFVRPTAYTNAAMVFLANKDYQKAEKYALDALQLSSNSGNLFMQKSAWGTLADLYETEKNYHKALEAHKKYTEFKDSLNNQNRRVEINRQQMEFDFEKKEAFSQAEIKRHKTIQNAIAFGGSVLLIAFFTGFVFYKRRRDAISKQKEAEFNALVSDTELKALRAQVNPHFIFNSLNSIGDYILKNDNEQAQEYLTQFAKLMRMVLENSEHKEILLSDDLTFIELYLQIESKRLPGKFSFSINVEEDLDTGNILVPPLLLQPFIENSIWHGFKLKEIQGHITVEIKRAGEMLVCSVDDNGSGRNPDSSRKSFGIAITENRLKILNQQKHADGKLKITDKQNNAGTRVEVSVPLEFSF